MESVRKQCTYTMGEKLMALELVDGVGVEEAAPQLGYPSATMFS